MQVRTDAYRQALLENPSLLKNAVVMDVGCGTGILRLEHYYALSCLVLYLDQIECVQTPCGFTMNDLMMKILEEFCGYLDQIHVSKECDIYSKAS